MTMNETRIIINYSNVRLAPPRHYIRVEDYK